MNILLPVLLLFTTRFLVISAYLGPTHCTKPGTSATSVIQSVSKGYSTFNHLLFDLTSLATSFKNGQIIPEERLIFNICAGTVIDLDDTSLPLGYLPISVPRVTIQCGDNGHQSDVCTIRGGGKHNPSSNVWNKTPQLKDTMAGIVGGGKDSVAQIYVYGKDAYEVTLKGLILDNKPTREEIDQYQQNPLTDDIVTSMNEEDDSSGNNIKDNNVEDVEDELLSSSGSTSATQTTDADGIDWNFNNGRRHQRGRNLQATFSAAYRFAAVAVRGNGYGDDAGPRIITIEDCKFQWHRGYAILVSPGIQEPTIPMVPASAFTQSNSFSGSSSSSNTGTTTAQYGNDGNRRNLNLLDNGANYIDSNGKVSYYDNTASINYLDSSRVKISRTEFVNNTAAMNNVAGLVTSAYSLTMTDCFFQSNDAKAMVFAYNNEALVKNTMFTENKVEVATIILASPKGSTPVSSNPTHLIEQSCFLGSSVGMSNVLVTDVETTGFGQRDNHAAGTQFSWVSNCEGAAAEKYGHECLESGKCDGTCVKFTSETCQADLSKTHHSGATSVAIHYTLALV
ncbi:hypothetical protein ACHAWC_007845, partial [Mediolabrus comicus]